MNTNKKEDNKYICYYNPQSGALTDSIELYFPTRHAFRAYMGEWQMSPNKKYLVGWMTVINQINILSLSDKQRKTIVIGKPKKDIKEVLDEKTSLPFKTYFTDINVTDDFIYVCYDPKEVLEFGSGEMTKDQKLLIFDFNGTPLYQLNIPYLEVFTVNESKGELYGVTNEGDIYKYDISGVLDEIRMNRLN